MSDSGMLGRRLSHYRVVGALGAGGMGHVYRAHDERLNRDVALKILSPELLEDQTARRRFRKESRALCRVIHPHIATLFDAADVDGVDFLVMELVPGPNLKQRLRTGWLEEREVIRLASQLARGLQAAHELGVVHRDIKPSNLAFTEDGLLKILDFGLALQVARKAADDGTQTETAAGVAAGTPHYMPPEQLMGRAVDARSDLYAVGAVLYEMVTRRHVFGDIKGAELTDATLNRPPRPPREVGGHLSAGLEAVILKLLDKDPRMRYQSARELLVDLERLERGLGTGSPPDSPSSTARARRRKLIIGVAGVLLLGVLGFLWYRTTRGTPQGPAPAAPVSLVPLTSSPGSERHPALSPSGRRLAYVADSRGEGHADVHVQDVGSHQSVAITTSGLPECCVAWTPDERDLTFVRLTDETGVIMRVGAGGGIERPLAELVPWFGTSLSVSPDGRSLAYPDRVAPDAPFSVVVLALDSLDTRALTAPSPEEVGDGFPAFSPDGEWVAFARMTTGPEVADIYVVRTGGGEPRRLTSVARFIGDLDWTPDGQSVLFLGGGSGGTSRMWRVGLQGGGAVRHWSEGDPLTPHRITTAEAVSSVSSSFRFSVARQSDRMALTRSSYDTDIWEMPIRESARPEPATGPLIASTRTDESPQLSPDGTQIAFTSLRSGKAQIWICNRAATSCAPLLSASNEDGTPRWSPDGRHIAFDARPAGQSDIFVVDVETRRARAVTHHSADDVVPSWSRDGDWIYFASRRTGPWQVFRVPVTGGEARQVTRTGGFAAFEVAGTDRVLFTRFHAPGLWAVPPDGGPETRVLNEPRCWGHWAVGGDGVYVAVSRSGQLTRLLRLDPESGKTKPVAVIPRSLPCGESALAVSSDGSHFLYAGIRETSDLVLVEE